MPLALSEADRLSIQNLVKDYSIEATPLQASRIDRFTDLFAPHTRIYIPQTPRGDAQDILALAIRLRREHMEPVPHLVARRINSLSLVDDFLARLAGDAGVTHALVVAGDAARPAGEIHSALQILDSGLLEKHRINTVGVAGHPEGHPVIADSVLRHALERKRTYAERTGASVYIVTQFTFSADPIIAWERSLDAAIGPLPVVVGLPGLATATTLLKFAVECGVGASLHAFAKRYSSITGLLTDSALDESLVALARHRAQTPHSRLARVHFYTFGSVEKTARWANHVVAGNFDLTAEGFIKPKEGAGSGLQES
jgi:methylenetetrahydrofolate reductase (NADH)